MGLPVFTIHGNHDDPAGGDNLSAVDLVSSCGLVNYFGKVVSGAVVWADLSLSDLSWADRDQGGPSSRALSFSWAREGAGRAVRLEVERARARPR